MQWIVFGVIDLGIQRCFARAPKGIFFGGDDMDLTENLDLVNAYCKRLKEVAGFGFVANPLPMRNSRNAVVYYLMFAGPNRTGWKIVQGIYRQHA